MGLLQAVEPNRPRAVRAPQGDEPGQRLVQSMVSSDSQQFIVFVLLKALGGGETTDLEFPLRAKTAQRNLRINATWAGHRQ